MSSSQNAKLTKQQRRDAAREQARKLREAQQRREKRNRLLIIIGVIVFIAIVAAAIVSIVVAANRAPLEGVDEQPSVATEDAAFPVGADGVGSVNDGAPVVDVYLDYLCIYCAQFESINGADLDELADGGEATVNYRPVAFLTANSDFSVRGANALAVVAEDSPEHFTDFNMELFAAQGEGATPLSDEQIAQIGLDVGVPQDVVDTFTDGRFNDWVVAATEHAAGEGVGGTPTVLIDGEELEPGVWQNPGALAQTIRDAA